MTRTEELEIKMYQEFAELIDAGKLNVLECDNVMPSSVEAPITFPSPGEKFGHVQYAIMANPAWRWYAFWRPRMIVHKFDEPICVHANGNAPQMPRVITIDY